MKKRILSFAVLFAFSVVSIFGCFAAAASVTAKVTKPSYLPEVGTLVLDDDFEGVSETESTIKSPDNSYSIADGKLTNDIANSSVGLVTEGGNKYVKFKKYGTPQSKVTGSVNSDKFVVSFDVLPASAAGMMIYCDSKSSGLCCKLAFKTITGDDDNYAIGLYSDNANSNSLLGGLSVKVSKSMFTKFSFVFERVLSGETYKTILSEAYCGDAELTLKDGIAEEYLTGNWSNVTAGNPTVLIGNFGADGFCLDNLLAYAPAVFETKSAVLGDDGKSVKITFSEEIGSTNNASVTVTDAVGNIKTASLSYSGKVLTAAFDTLADMDGKVVTLKVSGVESTQNKTAAEYTKVHGSGIENVDLANGKVTVRNALNGTMSGKLIVAAYGSDDKFLGAAFGNTDVNVLSDLSGTTEFTLPSVSSPSKYKFFVWRGTDDITPCCAQLEISAQ